MTTSLAYFASVNFRGPARPLRGALRDGSLPWTGSTLTVERFASIPFRELSRLPPWSASSRSPSGDRLDASVELRVGPSVPFRGPAPRPPLAHRVDTLPGIGSTPSLERIALRGTHRVGPIPETGSTLSMERFALVPFRLDAHRGVLRVVPLPGTGRRPPWSTSRRSPSGDRLNALRGALCVGPLPGTGSMPSRERFGSAPSVDRLEALRGVLWVSSLPGTGSTPSESGIASVRFRGPARHPPWSASRLLPSGDRLDAFRGAHGSGPLPGPALLSP